MSRLIETILILFILASLSSCECTDGEKKFPDGKTWTRNDNFQVVCENGKIKILNCLTDLGHVLEVGTKSYIENGVEYSCLDTDAEVEGSGEVAPVNVGVCSDFSDFSDDIYVGDLVICCISRRFKGCRTKGGDVIKSGHFVVGNNMLKFCNIQQQGWKARVEPKGCFNGTVNDSVEDSRFHVKKYTVWRKGDVDMRCGDDGISVYRCYEDDKFVYTGTAWIAKDGIVHECK
ncbi:unnamed protein product [Auanema sp. JU1783]|nr:unnamed protein product [Auanema sp. JU1783]